MFGVDWKEKTSRDFNKVRESSHKQKNMVFNNLSQPSRDSALPVCNFESCIVSGLCSCRFPKSAHYFAARIHLNNLSPQFWKDVIEDTEVQDLISDNRGTTSPGRY